MGKLIFVLLIFSTLVINAQNREDCIPPENLSAWAYYEDPYSIEINWYHSLCNSEWLYYDDGVCIDGLGGPSAFSWGIKFDPQQLSYYENLSVTMIRIFNLTSTTNTLQIFEDTNATTLLYEQELVGLDFEAWNNVVLNSPVPIDTNKELWITILTNDGTNYPAACGSGQGEPNGDLINQDGVLWEHLTDYNLNYTWNLGCYVEYAGGKEAILGAFKYKDKYFINSDSLAVSGNKISPNIWRDDNHSTKEWIGFNLYRDGELIAEEITNCSYIDYEASDYELYCYYATSVYSVCGESEPSNEDCFAWWMLSVKERDKLKVSLYPNHANNKITIEAENILRISLLNINGQQFFDQNLASVSMYTIDLYNYNPGIYIAKIYTEEGMVNRKFIISR
jgi:hypothetical protein